jgi:cell division protein FtsB
MPAPKRTKVSFRVKVLRNGEGAWETLGSHKTLAQAKAQYDKLKADNRNLRHKFKISRVMFY